MGDAVCAGLCVDPGLGDAQEQGDLVGGHERVVGFQAERALRPLAGGLGERVLQIPNRVNVALSRAQDLLIITTSLQAALEGRIGPPLQAVARFIAKHVEDGTPGYEILRPQGRRR